MKIISPAIAYIALTLSATSAAEAQSVSLERLNDWEFRFYACKNVVMNAAIITRLMERHQITNQDGIEAMQSQLGPALMQAVHENETTFPFSEDEASFVSDLTFSVVSGMVAGGFELSDIQIMRSGYDLCAHAIDGVTQ